jgi:hypothetical protein
MIPSGKYLHINAHVAGGTCIQTFLVTTSHDTFLIKVSTSFLTACQYPSLFGPDSACSYIGLSSSDALLLSNAGLYSSTVFKS